MSDSHDNEPQLPPESEAFVETLRKGYEPEAPSPARAQAFDAELRERLEEPQRESWVRPALVTATVGALIGWLLMPPAQEPAPAHPAAGVLAQQLQPEEEGGATIDDRAALADWEAALLGASEIEEFGAESEDAFLPDEYQAIAGAFLDG